MKLLSLVLYWDICFFGVDFFSMIGDIKMSNYVGRAFNPNSQKMEDALYLDDYYGSHRYGVQFSDGGIYALEDLEQFNETEFGLVPQGVESCMDKLERFKDRRERLIQATKQYLLMPNNLEAKQQLLEALAENEND